MPTAKAAIVATVETQKAPWEFGLVEERVKWAEAVLGEVFQMMGKTPKSIADFGGGAGSWCVAAKRLGVGKVMLIDRCQANEVHPSLDPTEHQECDMEQEIPAIGNYEMAICIEVAEHLSVGAGKRLIRALRDTSDLILFSAAVPGQGGIGHINEQWHEYWHEMFGSTGCICSDIIRPKLICRQEIPWWLRQNLFLYHAGSLHDRLEELPSIPEDLSIIHSDSLRRISEGSMGLRDTLKALPGAARRSLRRKLGRC